MPGTSGATASASASATNGRLTRAGAVALLAGLLVIGAAPSVVSRVRAEQAANAQWEELQTRRALRVAMDPGWQPFSFFGDTGWQGLDADLTREVARRLKLDVQPDPIGYDSLYDALHLKRDDIAVSAVVVDPSRTDVVAYTTSYFDAGVQMLTRHASDIRRPQDMEGKRVAVALGSDADRAARYWERRLPNLSRVTVDDDEAAWSALRAGSVDVALVESLFAGRAAGALAPGSLTVTSVEPRAYAIAVRSDNARLLVALNETLANMRSDGTLQRLVDQWVVGSK